MNKANRGQRGDKEKSSGQTDTGHLSHHSKFETLSFCYASYSQPNVSAASPPLRPVSFNGRCFCKDLKKRKNEVKNSICWCLCFSERVSGCADRSWNSLQNLFCGYRRKEEFISVLRRSTRAHQCSAVCASACVLAADRKRNGTWRCSCTGLIALSDCERAVSL